MYRVDYRLQSVDGDYRWTAARGVPLLDEDGTVIEWVGMNEDITSDKQAEEHANLIMRELSHRTKNLLAVIASLVRRTFDGNRDPQMQAADFVERIHGLARSHDLLVRGDWRGVSLNELVLSHLEPFGIAPERLSVEGPPIELRPEAAQNFGLALHELATNATKHGALKRSGTGNLKVKWRIEPNGGEPTLLLEWIEDTLAASGGSLPSGFGRVMLEQLIGASVGGSAKYDLSDARLYWQLKAPLQNIVSRNERT
jgi:two-component sensor histidine kinase